VFPHRGVLQHIDGVGGGPQHGPAEAPDHGIGGFGDIRKLIGQRAPTGDPRHIGLPPAAGRAGGVMGIQPPAGQGIPRIDVHGGHPVPEQPVSGLHDGPVIAELIDRTRDRDRPLEQHPGHPDREHHLRRAQAREQEGREPRREREIIPVILEP
jgi:hypothetical protein